MKKLITFLLSLPLLGASLVIDSGSASDVYFNGGAAFTTSTCAGDSTVRYGAFGYHIPLPPGVYLVTLNLCETGTVSGKNQRVFSVKLNGQLVIDRMDLFAISGTAPIERNYVGASNNGFLDIDFSYNIKSAVISSITVQTLFQGNGPIASDWQTCKSGLVQPPPVGTTMPPGWSCDGLQSYVFTLQDGTVETYVAVKMEPGFVRDPMIWVKQ